MWRFKFEAWDTDGSNLGATICFRGGIRDLVHAKTVAKQLYRKLYPGKHKLVRIWNQHDEEIFNSKRK